jgi:hypothetical protein
LCKNRIALGSLTGWPFVFGQALAPCFVRLMPLDVFVQVQTLALLLGEELGLAFQALWAAQ